MPPKPERLWHSALLTPYPSLDARVSKLERLSSSSPAQQGPTAAEHHSLKSENAQLHKLVRDLAARVEALERASMPAQSAQPPVEELLAPLQRELDEHTAQLASLSPAPDQANIHSAVQAALASAREYTDSQLAAHAPRPSLEETVPPSTIQNTVRSALASAHAYTDAQILRATDELKAELNTELDKTVDVIGQNAPAQVAALLPGMLPAFLPPLLGQLLPELLPDHLAEHFPQLLTEFIPEVFPQLLPQILPHLLPELLPEIHDHSQTALLTSKNYTDLARIDLSEALDERAEELAGRLGVVERAVAGLAPLAALGLGAWGERLAAVERALPLVREEVGAVRRELQAVEKGLRGGLEGVEKELRGCRGEVGALEDALRGELGRLEQGPLRAQVEGELKDRLKQELEEALAQGWTEQLSQAQAYADARFAQVRESVHALLEINRACVHFLAVRETEDAPEAVVWAAGGGR